MNRDTRRASAKTRSSVDDVKLGCSFFEKVGCTPEERPHLVTKTPPNRGEFRSDLHPGLALSTEHDGEGGG